MEWTTDPPTKKGWYFYQRIDGNFYYPVRVGYFARKWYPQVMRYEMSFHEFEPGKSRKRPYYFPLCDHLDETYRFAGPVEKPEEE